MTKYQPNLIIAALLLLAACSDPRQDSNSNDFWSGLEGIQGNEEYKASPYVTAGDRVYIVGHQDGTFPDLGWHVEGEMGGIWNHPIKLMDGFQTHLIIDDDTTCLDQSTTFTNYPLGNRFDYTVGDLEVERYQFVPDGIEGAIIEFKISNKGSEREVGFNFTGLIDLMPVWLAEKKNLTDGADEARYNQEFEAIIAKDQQNDWYTMFGADRRPAYHGIGSNPCNSRNTGKGTKASLRYDLNISSGGTEKIRFFIAGSYQSLASVQNSFRTLKNDPVALLQIKQNRYDYLNDNSQLTIDDEGLQTTYEWLKYNTDWLMRDVPEVGRGLSAGIPDYPWWFGADNAYSLQGMLATGMHEEVLSTIDLVMKLSHRANERNGRIMHEASTNGIVFNPGNLNETPHFIYTLWKVYQWTGDQSIIEKYYADIVKGIEWIESQDKDGNGYPDGPGMMEIHGLHSEMIDVAAYLAGAYQAAAQFASVVGDTELASNYQAKFDELVNKINTEWWVEDFQSYADFRASKKEAIELIEAAIVRADTIDKPWSREELEQTLSSVKGNSGSEELAGYVVHHNWVVNTPMEMGVAEESKALNALKTANKYTNRFGMYVTGMDRDENQEKAEKWKAFSYVGAVMTLPTGVQAMSEVKYGNPDGALAYLKMLENSFSYALPGSMYEVSPDYGMMAQAWNIYAMASPIVEEFFGIKPNAHLKKVTISPRMPTEWKNAKLSKVRIGDNEITVDKTKSEDTDVYRLSQTKDWEITFIQGATEVVFNDQEKVIRIE